MSYAKPDSSFIRTPVDEICGNPGDLSPASGITNGEPGYPKRTEGGRLPEVTRDGSGEFPGKQG